MDVSTGLRIRLICAASAAHKILHSVNLSSHFELVFVYGVVPAFDINGADKAGLPKNADDVGPVCVAEAGRSVPNPLFS